MGRYVMEAARAWGLRYGGSAAIFLAVACGGSGSDGAQTSSTTSGGSGGQGSTTTSNGGAASGGAASGGAASGGAASGGAASGGSGGAGACVGGGAANCNGSACACTALGLVPLSDLGTGTYQGRAGGLYGDGKNERPAAHEAAGLALAQSIGPLAASGAPDPSGKYVFLSIGMSNTTHEFSTFVPLAMADPEKDPALVVIDGAQSGIVANEWANPNHGAWGNVNDRLAAAALTPEQVTVAWVKTAIAGPQGDFQTHHDLLHGYMVSIVQNLHDKFPNIKLTYLSSRAYAGYAEGVSQLNPEPYAYEGAFSVQQLLLDQLTGASTVTFSGPSAVAPWLSWGPYLWADGLNPRCDGLTWACSNFNADGTHPSASGRQMVAQMLLDFVKTDTTARAWFVGSP